MKPKAVSFSNPGIKSPQVKRPQLPANASNLWAYFLELNERREYDKFGLKPLSYQQIYYWSKVTRTILRLWEIKAILKADDVYLTNIKAK